MNWYLLCLGVSGAVELAQDIMSGRSLKGCSKKRTISPNRAYMIAYKRLTGKRHVDKSYEVVLSELVRIAKTPWLDN